MQAHCPIISNAMLIREEGRHLGISTERNHEKLIKSRSENETAVAVNKPLKNRKCAIKQLIMCVIIVYYKTSFIRRNMRVL